MKRASRMMTSRTMSGSGPVPSPNQDAMPRAGSPRAQTVYSQVPARVPGRLCQVPARRPGAGAASSVQPWRGGGVSEARGRHSKGPTLFPPRPNPGPPWQEKTDRGREQPPWRRGPAPFIPSARLSGPTRAALSGPGWGEAPPPPALT